MNNAGAMTTAAPPPSSNNEHIMHMTFFWGKNAEILFSGWPGYNNMAFIIEWLSHSNYVKESVNHVAAGFIETLLYGIRMGLAYLVMLAVMSFNGGIFVAAILGHVLGFWLFGSRTFQKSKLLAYAKASDLPSSMPCNC
ncbi:unnamed protein product [Withania somnifera]